MKRLLLFLTLALFISTQLSAQLNAVLRDQLVYPNANQAPVNDVWAYVAPDGTEYAIVGLVTGVSFVSLADPDNIVEVASIPGQFSSWRDMKTFGEYAYVVADQGSSNEGLTIIDLTDLENGNVTFTQNNYEIPGAGTLLRAHNVYLDESKGYLLIAGSNASNGVLFFDVASTPGEAIYLTTVGVNYAHDTYLHNDVLYNSEISNGRLSIWDVSDLFDPVLLSSTITPFAFCHNAWSTDGNDLIFTTDERANAPVAAYDISDPTDPILIDEYRPIYSLGTGTIPHNVHVLDSFLITSYYTDGVTVVDASKPDNLIEVANWDTWSGAPGGFNGCWGAYPFLPSGLVLASDRSNGLFVVEIDYKRAARLEGLITDEDSGLPINGVEVEISATQENEGETNAAGRYATGLADAGTYNVTFQHPDYLPLTLSVELLNGVCTVLDTSLQSTQVRHPFSANVIETGIEFGIEGAEVLLVNLEDEVSIFSDEDGLASFGFVPEGTYDVYVGRWGYRELLVESLTINGSTQQTFELERGYQDGFQLDQGWTTSADEATTTGFWERAIPNGTTSGSVIVAPFFDAEDDLGDMAYVTGNSDASLSAGFDDIDDGRVILTSPIFDLSIYQDTTVRLSYQYWFINFGGGSAPDDELRVSISNGETSVDLGVHTFGALGETWRDSLYRLTDFITLTDQMQLTVITGDLGAGNVTEAGFDDFLIEGELLDTRTENVALPGLEVEVFPNPSEDGFNFRYRLPSSRAGLEVRVVDLLGRTLETQRLAPFASGMLRFGFNLPAGTYFLRMLDGSDQVYSTKLIKN